MVQSLIQKSGRYKKKKDIVASYKSKERMQGGVLLERKLKDILIRRSTTEEA